MFLRKCVPKVQEPYRSVISIQLLLKSHFVMGVLLQTCCIFSGHRFLRTSLDGCFWLLILACAASSSLVGGNWFFCTENILLTSNGVHVKYKSLFFFFIMTLFNIRKLQHFWTFRKSHENNTLRENCRYSEFFWSVFSRIRTEYGEIRSITPYSVWMRENTD